MKKKMTRVLAMLLCLVLCATAMNVASGSVSAAADGTMPIMAFVPLDNRPVCVDRIKYQAASAGFDVRMPAEELYTTRLDGQGGNIQPYGCQIGDGAAIMDWLEQMDAAGCNWYVIHLDQMFSGGLVGSRYPDQNALTATETNIMDRLIALSNTNHIYFVDTVMRLASTGSFKGYAQPEYGSFREYAAQIRKELDKSKFRTTDYNTSVAQLDLIQANYQKGPSGETLTFYTGEANAWKGPLTQSQINTYHGSRRRKMDLINLMMQYGNRSATYVIGVDDSSPEFTIQGNEINFIHQRMQALGYTYFLSADTDSSGMMAVSRAVTDYYGRSEIPVRVRYYGSMADQPADDYDIGTLRENVASHLATANCEAIESGTGEMELLVLTRLGVDDTIKKRNGRSTTYEGNIDKLIAQAKTNIANNKPTIIVECSTEDNYLTSWVKGYKNLQDEMLAQLEISKLMGYSNWNTVGNTLGIAIGQGVARYVYLKNETNVSPASNNAFKQAMTYSFVKDITYNARNKHQNFTWTFQYWINNKAGGTGWNSSNFYQQMFAYDGNKDGAGTKDWELCDGEHYVNNELQWSLMRGGDAAAYNGCGQQVLNVLMAGDIYTNFNGTVKTEDFGNVAVTDARCPWFRQFEITFKINLTLPSYYSTYSSYMTKIPVKHGYTTFQNQAAKQYSAMNVIVKNLDGQVLAASDRVATGYQVSMTVNGQAVSYKAVIRGDVDSNGLVNTSDVRYCLQNVLESPDYKLADATFEAADLDGNDRIGSTDARRILQEAITAA